MATVSMRSDMFVPPELRAEYPDLNLTVRRIYPAEARTLLKDHSNPRPSKSQWVRELAESLRRGEGQLTWDAIVITGDVLGGNGQHRLEAIVESGVYMDFIVIEGLPTVDVCAGDRVALRKIGEILGGRGEKNYNRLAALLAHLANFERTGEPTVKAAERLSPFQAVALLDANPDVREAAVSRCRLPAISPSGADLLWLLTWRIDPEDCESFFGAVSTGVALDEEDVRYKLRERLSTLHKSSTTNAHPRVLAAFFVQAWNAYRQGVPRAIFRFKPGGANPDRFPLLDGHTYTPEQRHRLHYE